MENLKERKKLKRKIGKFAKFVLHASVAYQIVLWTHKDKQEWCCIILVPTHQNSLIHYENMMILSCSWPSKTWKSNNPYQNHVFEGQEHYEISHKKIQRVNAEKEKLAFVLKKACDTQTHFLRESKTMKLENTLLKNRLRPKQSTCTCSVTADRFPFFILAKPPKAIIWVLIGLETWFLYWFPCFRLKP